MAIQSAIIKTVGTSFLPVLLVIQTTHCVLRLHGGWLDGLH